MRKQQGFTLIELMIVVAIIAIIAAIAIPNLLSARLNANETSAISTLRNISSAQAQFQASSKCDVDNDGTGEFGYFRELSGGVGIRTNATATAQGSVLNPPVLSGAFRAANDSGIDRPNRSGYRFYMYLPSTGAIGTEVLAGTGSTFAGDTLSADLAETTWCCYAAPVNYGNSGNRMFFVNQQGDITSKDDANWQTNWHTSQAFVLGSLSGGITGQVAIGTTGFDNQMWRQVN